LIHHDNLHQNIHHALCDQLAPNVQGQEPRRQHDRDGPWRAAGDRPELIFFEQARADETETQRAVSRRALVSLSTSARILALDLKLEMVGARGMLFCPPHTHTISQLI